MFSAIKILGDSSAPLFFRMARSICSVASWVVIFSYPVAAIDESELRSDVLRCLPSHASSIAVHATFSMARRLPGDFMKFYQGDDANQNKGVEADQNKRENEFDHKGAFEAWVDGTNYWYAMDGFVLNRSQKPKIEKRIAWGTLKKSHILSTKDGQPVGLTIGCDAMGIAAGLATPMPAAYRELLGFPKFKEDKPEAWQPVRNLVLQGTVRTEANADKTTFERTTLEGASQRTEKAIFRKRDNNYLCERYERSYLSSDHSVSSSNTRVTFTYDSILSDQACGKIPVSCLSEELIEVNGQLTVSGFNYFQLESYETKEAIPAKLLQPSLGRSVRINDLCNPPKPKAAASWSSYWWLILLVSILLVVVGVWRSQKWSRT